MERPSIYLRYAWFRRDDGRGTRGELFAIALHRLLGAVVWFSAIGCEGWLPYWCFVPVIYPGLAAALGVVIGGVSPVEKLLLDWGRRPRWGN